MKLTKLSKFRCGQSFYGPGEALSDAPAIKSRMKALPPGCTSPEGSSRTTHLSFRVWPDVWVGSRRVGSVLAWRLITLRFVHCQAASRHLR